MAADFYRSSHGSVTKIWKNDLYEPSHAVLDLRNYWLIDRKTLANARALDLRYATPQEIAWIAIWSANAIHKLAKRLNLRQQVTATAIIYLRRFYLKNSYCETDVPLVAAACVYVAAKAEETAMHIKVVVTEARATFSEYGITAFPSDSTKLAEMEFYLLEDLEFHLIVFHPYRSLINMTGRDSGPVAVRETMLDMEDNVLQMAWFVLNDTYRTELCVIYPPHIIAIGAIYLAFSLHAPSSIFAAHRANTGSASTSAVNSPAHSGHLPRGAAASTPLTAAIENPMNAAGKNQAAAGQSTRGKVDPITWLASLNVQLPMILEVVQEILSLYALWKSYEETPHKASSPSSSGMPGERGYHDSMGHKAATPGFSTGLSNPGAAPGAGDERVIQILARMRMNREMDLAHPANAGQPGK